MIPLIGGFSRGIQLGISAVVLGLIGWGAYSVYDAIRDHGYRQGAADTIQAERLCNEGTVCADTVVRRAAEQAAVVAAAVQRAAERATQAANIQIEQEIAARTAAESREKAAHVAASAAERRYQQALATNQACSEWASRPVPCPLSSE